MRYSSLLRVSTFTIPLGLALSACGQTTNPSGPTASAEPTYVVTAIKRLKDLPDSNYCSEGFLFGDKDVVPYSTTCAPIRTGVVKLVYTGPLAEGQCGNDGFYRDKQNHITEAVCYRMIAGRTAESGAPTMREEAAAAQPAQTRSGPPLISVYVEHAPVCNIDAFHYRDRNVFLGNVYGWHLGGDCAGNYNNYGYYGYGAYGYGSNGGYVDGGRQVSGGTPPNGGIAPNGGLPPGPNRTNLSGGGGVRLSGTPQAATHSH